MPFPELRHRYQKALLWRATGLSDNYGNPTVGSPEEIRVRWNWGRTQGVDSQGNTIALDADAVVGEDITIGSNMWLAPDQSADSDTALEQWYGTGSAGTDTGVMYVQSLRKVPDLRNRVHSRSVKLMRYKNTLPDGE